MTEKIEDGSVPADRAKHLDYARMLDALADPVVAAGTSGHIVYANAAVESLLGWPPGELAGQPLAVIQPPRLRAVHAAGFERYLRTGVSAIMSHPIRVPALHRDGHEIDIELTLANVAVLEGDRLIVASLRDLRDRVELERQLTITQFLRSSTAAASRLSSLLDFDAVLRTVIATLVDDFDATLARIWLAEPNSRTLYLRAQGGPGRPPKEADASELHFEALPVWLDGVVRTRTIFVANDLATDARFDHDWLRQQGIVAVGAFPLQIGGELAGIMVLFLPRPFTSDFIDVLASFAAIVTASINDVQLFVREMEARSDSDEARGRFAFLAEASRVLTSSLDVDSTLRTLAHVVVPRLADWCVIDVLDDSGAIQRLETAHVDPARLSLVDELRRRYPRDPTASGAIMDAVRTGESRLVREIPPEALDQVAQDEEHRGLLHSLGIRSFMCVPLVARDRVRGTISFITAESGRIYGRSDLDLAEDLAGRAAISVDNARLHEEVQAALHERDEFLSSVSHDLKNPIAAIKGRAQMLRRRAAELDGEEGARLVQGLENIDNSATRMTRLISELVDVARMRSGQPIELDRSPVDLVAIIRLAITEQSAHLESHTVRLQNAEDTLVGDWDADRLNRVFANLLGNAGKYSSPGSEIIVSVRCEHRNERPVAEISVTDGGIGIPAADLPHVFERYYRGANVGSIEGTGIGLAGAWSIVEQHGGTISVTSEEGRGTSFTIRLPLSAGEQVDGF